jgi:hypothetical protein
MGATQVPSSSSTTASTPSWFDRAKAATIEHPAVLQFEKDHPVAAVIAKEVAITAAEALVPGLATVNAVRTFAAPNASRTDKTFAGISVVGSALPVIGAVLKGTVKLAKAVATARKVSRTTKVVEEAAETSAKAAQAITRSAARTGREASNVLLRTGKQLQAKFKHATDFGVSGNYSKVNAAEFSRAVHQHINSSGVRAIEGTYHKQPVTHYRNRCERVERHR